MTNVIVAAVAAVVVVFTFLLFAGLFAYLHYRNKHPPPPEKKEHHPLWYRVIEVFVKDFLLEIIGLVMTVYTILGFYQNDWGDLQMNQTFIAFYIFMSLKYALLIVEVLLEYKFEEIDDKITYKLARIGIRSDWKGLLHSLIFVPSVIIDGLMNNAEYYTGNNQNIFVDDGIIMIAIDTLIWLKLVVRLLLHQYSAGGKPPYYLKHFAYALVIHFFSLLLVLLLIFEHLRLIHVIGMNIGSQPVLLILLINALTHSYVCSFSSMMASQIVALDRALRGSKARIKQLKLFIRFLQRSIVGVLSTLIVMGYSLYIYISVWVVLVSITYDNFRSESAIQGAIFAVIIVMYIFNAFFTINYGYAFAKRLGGYLSWRSPFPNCSTYSAAINGILSQCSANFGLDERGQIVGRR